MATLNNRDLAAAYETARSLGYSEKSAMKMAFENCGMHKVCPDKHTPQTPHKNRARLWGLEGVPKEGTIATISPGNLGTLQLLGWEGRILIIDKCAECVDATRRLRREYYDLDIAEPIHGLVEEEIPRIFDRGTRLDLLDLDLAMDVRGAKALVDPLLHTLTDRRIHTTVLLTYVNHRDWFGRGANNKRTNYLIEGLPRRTKYVDTFYYGSGWSNEHHNWSKGSAMAVAKFRT